MRWSTEATIAALRGWAYEHGRPPTFNAFRVTPRGCPSRTTIVKLFGSWSAALEAAGFQARGRGEYARVCRLPERVCGVCGGRFRRPRRFKFCSAKCGAVASGRARRCWTRDAAAGSLHEWAAAHGRPPGIKEWQRVRRPPSTSTLVRIFGSWRAAIVAAGLAPRGRGERI